jgi:hypothetical protein
MQFMQNSEHKLNTIKGLIPVCITNQKNNNEVTCGLKKVNYIIIIFIKQVSGTLP